MAFKTNERDYLKKRQKLVEANSNLLGVILNEKEQRLNEILQSLKAEYKQSCGGKIPFDIPVLTDKKLTQSRLYEFCLKLPKGADLHVHDMAQLPLDEFIEVLLKADCFCIDIEKKRYDLVKVKKGEPKKNGYMPLKEALQSGTVKRADLLKQWTIMGAKSNNMSVWDFFEELFERHSAICNDLEFAKIYYEYTFNYYYEHGIYQMEIHLLLSDDIDVCADYIKTVRAVYYDFKKTHPDFYLKIIGAGMKYDSENLETTKKCYLNTLYAQETIKDESDSEHVSDFVIGFDLINEEDANLPLKNFAPLLLKAKEKYPSMRFFIHGGESLDAKNDNLIDAYLLGVSRVGHGLNLYRYPDLLERYSKSEICLEVCVISNQTLGYTKDIRNHPAVEYLRRGVSIALCSDDPVYQENSTLTDDFFAATVCWDLSVADIKQLAINSIAFSGLDNFEKTKLLKAYRQKWNLFVDYVLENF